MALRRSTALARTKKFTSHKDGNVIGQQDRDTGKSFLLDGEPTAELVPAGKRNSLLAWAECYMAVEGRAGSLATADAKRRDIRAFLLFFSEATQFDDIDGWTRSLTGDFVRALEGQGLKAESINRRLATLRRLANWIAAQRPLLAGNPCEGISDLILDVPDWHGLTRVQVTRVRSAAEQLRHLQRRGNQRPYRNFALFTLLLNTGLRISEALSLDLSQFTGKHLRDVRRKGRVVSRTVFLNKEARKGLELYLEKERGREAGPLFQSG